MLCNNDLSKRARNQAFTLVELLVVIGIIAILISVLLPALTRARDSAVSLKCTANMRTLGQALRTFANDFGDRVPSHGQYARPSWSSCTWDEILNLYYFKLGGVDRFNGRSERTYWVNGVVGPRQLGCPAIVVGENTHNGFRGFGLNTWLGGSENNSGTFPWAVRHPNPTFFHNDFANPAGDPGQTLGHVTLGARMTKFANISDKIMVIEKERSNQWAHANGTNPVTRNNDSTYNTYAANGGMYTFRHARKTRMNTLFMDGHVGSFHYQDTDFNVKRRFEYK